LLGRVAFAQDPQTKEAKGLPPRATPGDYQASAKAGEITVAAEFKGHSVPTAEGVFTTEDFVAVEIGLFGPSGAPVKVSHDDFSLRVNGKKTPTPAQPYAAVFKSLKDPEWIPPNAAEAKGSKTSINGGGGDGSKPALAKMPVELERAMDQKVRKVALPEGDRNFPEAGLIFIEYRGKESGIRSLELIYSGSAGKATLTLQP
ncbi:MAG TPA: hypothetical protein VKR43_01410, partial [Bryobacteraceae bacterium]|nr:hypothetical protein [Bryobacteraceae bacterium]